MTDNIQPTFKDQFVVFSKLMDSERNGAAITLYRSDYWLRQTKVIDNREITMTDTGIIFNKCSGTGTAMGDEEQATLEGQFFEYSRLMDNKRSGDTITLYRADYWLRQAHIMDDRKLTMTDTGIIFNKFCKTEITYEEWLEFLSDLCEVAELDEEMVKDTLTNCGSPGLVTVIVPAYRDFFLTYTPKEKGAVWDGFLCWPPTEANTVVFQACPPRHLIDTSNKAFRKCDTDGHWVGKHVNDTIGWTNYTPCFIKGVKYLIELVYVGNDTAAESKLKIAQRTRHLEIAGFGISLLALTVSMLIYCRYRSLRNSRTKIHQSLFSAMILQVLIRLTVYIDQAITRGVKDNFINDNITRKGIDDMPYVCEMSYVLLEYTISAMFMWMFIEGLYLHNVVTANSLRQKLSHGIFYMIGWGTPLAFTIVWAIATVFVYKNDNIRTCWYGYNFTWWYWILQGPRLAIIMVNLIFLLKILRVLIVKLQDSRTSELEKLRKAVRAALVLLPLLGITNLLNMLEAPLDGAVWKFALWCYITHFLRSFQGFFIALIYCFMNGEVKSVIYKQYQVYKSLKMSAPNRSRNDGATRDDTPGVSRYASNGSTNRPVIPPPSAMEEEERRQPGCLDILLCWCRKRSASGPASRPPTPYHAPIHTITKCGEYKRLNEPLTSKEVDHKLGKLLEKMLRDMRMHVADLRKTVASIPQLNMLWYRININVALSKLSDFREAESIDGSLSSLDYCLHLIELNEENIRQSKVVYWNRRYHYLSSLSVINAERERLQALELLIRSGHEEEREEVMEIVDLPARNLPPRDLSPLDLAPRDLPPRDLAPRDSPPRDLPPRDACASTSQEESEV